MHTWTAGQAWPQPPQLSRSSSSFTHWLAQTTSSPEQAWHFPAMHARPVGHVTPQAPQLVRSSCRLTQLPLHQVLPLGHEGAGASAAQPPSWQTGTALSDAASCVGAGALASATGALGSVTGSLASFTGATTTVGSIAGGTGVESTAGGAAGAPACPVGETRIVTTAVVPA